MKQITPIVVQSGARTYIIHDRPFECLMHTVDDGGLFRWRVVQSYSRAGVGKTIAARRANELAVSEMKNSNESCRTQHKTAR